MSKFLDEIIAAPLPNDGICMAKDCNEEATTFAMADYGNIVDEIGACSPGHRSAAYFNWVTDQRICPSS